MTKHNIGILHPGNMGISIAASAQNSGHTVYWASKGRSRQTHERAERYNLMDAKTLGNLCETCSVIISICPPKAAEEVANQVLEHSFQGLYIDANAISPQRAYRIGQTVNEAGAMFVDGSIIGGPAWQPDSTWLYLSGPNTDMAAACFAAGPLETSVIGESLGRASALKMCYAAYTKGTSALLCAILATAEKLGVREELGEQWSRDDPDFTESATRRVRRVSAKAWRFEGEMEEISSTFSAAGVPDGFHAAAATLYHRISQFKDAPSPPPLEEVLSALLKSEV